MNRYEITIARTVIINAKSRELAINKMFASNALNDVYTSLDVKVVKKRIKQN